MIIFLVVLTTLGEEEIIIINGTYLKVPESNTTNRIPQDNSPSKGSRK